MFFSWFTGINKRKPSAGANKEGTGLIAPVLEGSGQRGVE
jgi:hypothetical protein